MPTLSSVKTKPSITLSLLRLMYDLQVRGRCGKRSPGIEDEVQSIRWERVPYYLLYAECWKCSAFAPPFDLDMAIADAKLRGWIDQESMNWAHSESYARPDGQSVRVESAVIPHRDAPAHLKLKTLSVAVSVDSDCLFAFGVDWSIEQRDGQFERHIGEWENGYDFALTATGIAQLEAIGVCRKASDPLLEKLVINSHFQEFLKSACKRVNLPPDESCSGYEPEFPDFDDPNYEDRLVDWMDHRYGDGDGVAYELPDDYADIFAKRMAVILVECTQNFKCTDLTEIARNKLRSIHKQVPHADEAKLAQIGIETLRAVILIATGTTVETVLQKVDLLIDDGLTDRAVFLAWESWVGQATWTDLDSARAAYSAAISAVLGHGTGDVHNERFLASGIEGAGGKTASAMIPSQTSGSEPACPAGVGDDTHALLWRASGDKSFDQTDGWFGVGDLLRLAKSRSETTARKWCRVMAPQHLEHNRRPRRGSRYRRRLRPKSAEK